LAFLLLLEFPELIELCCHVGVAILVVGVAMDVIHFALEQQILWQFMKMNISLLVNPIGANPLNQELNEFVCDLIATQVNAS